MKAVFTSEFNAFDVANYFLALADDESGEFISNLKLQKLVYYAQGFHLAMYEKPLYNDIIEAWEHGPVIPILYHHYKEHGADPIPFPSEIDFSKYSKNVKDLLDEVYGTYGQFSAWKLRNMTHSESPYLSAYNNPVNKIITHELMKEYFKTLLQ